MIQNWVVLTEAQKDALMAYDNSNVMLGARAIDNALPGVGININPDAADFDTLEAVPLVGMWVVPRHMIDDGQYIIYAPLMVDGLKDKPWCALESQTIFAPVVFPFTP